MDQCPSCGHQEDKVSTKRPRPGSGVPYRSMMVDVDVKKLSLLSRVKSACSVLYVKTPSKIVNGAKVGGKIVIGASVIGVPGFLLTWGLYKLGYVIGTYVFGVKLNMEHSGPHTTWPINCWGIGFFSVAGLPLVAITLWVLYNIGHRTLQKDE